MPETQIISTIRTTRMPFEEYSFCDADSKIKKKGRKQAVYSSIRDVSSKEQLESRDQFRDEGTVLTTRFTQ